MLVLDVRPAVLRVVFQYLLHLFEDASVDNGILLCRVQSPLVGDFADTRDAAGELQTGSLTRSHVDIVLSERVGGEQLEQGPSR